MRPTFSIILFTVLSGAGYGLLFLAGLSLALGWPLVPPSTTLFDGFSSRNPAMYESAGNAFMVMLVLAIGALLATTGLLSSVGHLGKPLRAWRAFSQWRSSWLSREGVASLLAYLPIAGIFLIMRYAGDSLLPGAAACGLLLALSSFATVFCTGHIYAVLKPIRAWHNPYVVPGYLLFGVYTGALWMVAMYLLPIAGAEFPLALSLIYVANAFLIAPLCAILKRAYWRSLDTMADVHDAGAATGLGRLGVVRSFEQPHTEENYLTHEMGFVLARKHARRLRAIAFWLILLAPLSMLPVGYLIGYPAAWVALALGMTGVFVERWLFFAEARHTVMAFYGR